MRLCAAALLFLFPVLCVETHAQARATADRKLEASVFTLVGATATGLEAFGETSTIGGRNLTLTAGADLDFYAAGRFLLGAEVRGTYPLQDGKIASERSLLGGARASYITAGDGALHALRPYADVLFGRGQIDYANGGYLTTNFLYTRTVTNVFGAGAGLEWDVSNSFSAKLDGQVQHWNTPVVSAGAIYSKQISLGVVYRFGAGQGPR